jgi:hypothetical protein
MPDKPVFNMSLVERLRDPDYMKRWWDQIGDGAAREIERLRAALVKIVNIESAACHDEPHAFMMGRIAKDALGGKVRGGFRELTREDFPTVEGGGREDV